MSLLSFTKKLRNRSEGPTKKSAKKADKKEEVVEEAIAAAAPSVLLHIDLRPLVTEKGVLLSERNTAVFRVSRLATKQQIVRAIEDRYKVTPLSVRTLLVRPKRRRRGRTEGSTSSWKKAYVTVKDIQALSAGP